MRPPGGPTVWQGKRKFFRTLNLPDAVYDHRGSAISLALSYYTVLVLLVAYIYCSGIYRDTWEGQQLDSAVDKRIGPTNY